MVSRTPPALVQRRRLYRWVAAVGLLAVAEEQRAADVPETNAMGLLGAHAACEAMLGLIIGPLPHRPKQPPRERYFPILLDLAGAVAKPPIANALRDDLLTMHDVRNSFVHGGSAVDAAELDRAVDVAHALAEHVPLPGSRNLVGVATVVAEVIQIEAVGAWLRHADEQRTRGHLRLSADAVARALDNAIDRTVPRVRTRTGMSSRAISDDLRRISAGGGTRDYVREETTAAIDQLTKWVYPMALGTPPATLEFIRNVVGYEQDSDLGGHPSPVSGPTSGEPAPGDLRRATSLVSRIILRLSALGGVAARQGDDKLIEFAHEFQRKELARQ